MKIDLLLALTQGAPTSAIMLSMAYIRVSSVLSAHLYLFVDKKMDIHYSIQHVTVELDTQDTLLR